MKRRRTDCIRIAGIKYAAHSEGKRVSKTFIRYVDNYVRLKVLAACRVWNGRKKTLDDAIAAVVFK